MLTDDELRMAFKTTYTVEPSDEDWPYMERFAREVERLVQAKYKLPEPNHGRNCAKCGRWRNLNSLVIRNQQWYCNPSCSSER